MQINLQRGLDLVLPGEPEQVVYAAAPVSEVAVLGPDYAEARPRLAVAEGEFVSLGQTLFTDRRDAALRYTSPASGRVVTVLRGRRRRLLAISIEIDPSAQESNAYAAHARDELPRLAHQTVRERLLDSGLWTAFRARPFDAVPSSQSAPRAILVTAMDSNPLAANPLAVLADQRQEFADGLTVLARICNRVVLCSRPAAFRTADFSTDIELAEFSGPHPAGLPGTHLQFVGPAAERGDVWHIGYQDVVAIGVLFVTGSLMTERVVALGGPGAMRPRLLRTRLGAAVRELLHDEMTDDGIAIAGSVLAGRRVDAGMPYLGRYDTQISILRESAEPNLRYASQPARPSGMLNVEAFERVWPFDMPPLPLLRALLTLDVEMTRRLGGLALAAEDLALCSYICPAKQDYGTALNATLDRYREEL